MKPNNYKGGSMKRTLMMTLAVLLNCAVLCLPANAQTGKEENPSAQDLLVRNEVETAVSMLQAIFAKQQQGEMTPEQAKKLGADLLRELRYGTDGYFWADTTEGVNVVLYGRKDVEGRKRIEDKDLKGTFYVRNFSQRGKTAADMSSTGSRRRGRLNPNPRGHTCCSSNPSDGLSVADTTAEKL